MTALVVAATFSWVPALVAIVVLVARAAAAEVSRRDDIGTARRSAGAVTATVVTSAALVALTLRLFVT